MAEQNPDKLEIYRLCNNTSCIDKEKLRYFYIEGAEAISPDLGQIEILYNIGLRSIGPT